VALISALTFLDRMSIAVLGPAIQRDFPISSVQWGFILSAYVIAYSVFEIPSGVFGDRHGYHRELTRIALWWSVFISLTALGRTVWQFASARFLFGLGAAGAYPNLTGMLYRWMPARERARAQGVMWAAGRLGGGLAPLLLVPLAAVSGWQGVFLILGAAGFLWAMLWHRFIRSRPADQPGITAAELTEIGAASAPTRATPWKELARLPQLWLIALAYGIYGSGPWFYFSWFPTWLVKSAGFSVREMGIYASLPFFLGVAANLAGGVVCDRLALRFGMRRAYAGMSCSCLLLTGLFMMALSLVHSKWLISVLASLGFGAMDLMLPCAWSMCMAIGGRVGGTATAVMNTVGNLGGLFCTFGFGYILEATGSYEAPLRAVAAMVILSGVIFSTIDCSRGLDARAALPIL
jgi:MFS transporter, ACS family, glucarate transporter